MRDIGKKLYVGAMILAGYAGVTFGLPALLGHKKAEVEPGKSYTLSALEYNDSFIPLFRDRIYFSLTKTLDGENVRGLQSAEIAGRKYSRRFGDDNLDGEVDYISFEENDISVKFTRTENFETHREDFIFGDNYLRETRKRFKDFIAEVERKAGFAK